MSVLRPSLMFGLYEYHASLAAFLTLLVRPDGCLDFSDVAFLKQYHAESALSYATSYCGGK